MMPALMGAAKVQWDLGVNGDVWVRGLVLKADCCSAGGPVFD